MTFRDLNLNKSLLRALDDLGITTPTPIQQKAFSPIMKGDDVVGIAQTGTGKTFAYLLPTLSLWKFTKSPAPQILIMVPTRELVAQVVEEVKKLSSYMTLEVVAVYGGTNTAPQIAALQAGVDVVVGTPGRLLDLMLKGALKTKKIKHLIIDEVDEMLNHGFRTQLNTILEFMPNKRQNLMFSATMPDEVEEIIETYTSYYQMIEAASSGAALENIEQYAYPAQNFNTKANLLQLLLDTDDSLSKVLVFVRSKKMADTLYEKLLPHFGETFDVIHSSKSQNYRFKTVNALQDGTYRFVIATDIVARGLDIAEITHVINFDLPEVAERYVHRIGRTGRAEKKGIAISFIAEQEAGDKAQIEDLMDIEINMLEVPAALVVSEELIPLEILKDELPFIPIGKPIKPSGGTFHEKAPSNQKVNKKVSYEDQMKRKYKKQYRKKSSR